MPRRPSRRGEFDAAVGAAVAGELYGLDVVAHDIADNGGAVTRFVLLTRPTPPPPPTGNDRTTLVAYLREDHAGALLEILSEFGTRGVNLTRIESRPTKGRIGQYCFSIDCEGHLEDERVGDVLGALHRICSDVRYLGSYPRRDGTQGPVPIGRRDAEFLEARAWLAKLRETGPRDRRHRRGRRPEPPVTADERATLEGFLDFHRATLELKCRGLTPEQLAERAVPPSSLSLLGLVRHLADVERSWFDRFALRGASGRRCSSPRTT